MRRIVVTTAALIALPIAVHFGAVQRLPVFGVAAVALVLLPALLSTLRARKRAAAVVLLVVCAALWLLFGSLSLLYAIPVAVQLSLLTLFGSTLLPGRTPLITAYVQLQYDTVSAATRRYTRRVTAAWTCFFAVMALQCLLLALLAPLQIWSLFVNFLNYVFVLAFFVIEFAVRKHVLRERQHAGFGRYIAGLVRTDFRRLLKSSS